MAKGQQLGVGALTVWMIVFVALWLASTVFLVILYTGQEDIVSENTRLKKQNDTLISPSEESSLTLVRNSRPSKEGGPTVVGILEQNRADTALVATGDTADDAATVRTKRDQLLETIARDQVVPDAGAFADASFYEGMTTLYEAFKSEHELRSAAEQRVVELDAELASMVQRNAEQKNDFDARAKKLADRLAEVEADRDAYRAEREASVAALETEFDEQRAQADADLTRERQRRTALESNLVDLRDRYRSLQHRLGAAQVGPDELGPARKADGIVLTAVPGDEVVYIDLGRDDRLTIGLQFSVYPAAEGIPADGRAKARIEVVSVAQSSAECRIVAVASNELILEGDLVANPVFDPHRKLSFLVIGRFDMDGDGSSEPDGAAVIGAMVSGWGGDTTTELTSLTDFVILGAPPPRPRPGGEALREQTARDEATQREWDTYAEIVALARDLSIPVLTQEVFFNFLGY